MGKSIFFVYLFVTSFVMFAQKPFQGVLVYNVYLQDTSLHSIFPPEKMILYTNDTLLRIETQTHLTGQQTQIRHLQKQRSILLLDSPKGKYGIQIIDTSSVIKYNYNIAKGKTRMFDYKAKNVLITNNLLKSSFNATYIPQISGKYVPGFENSPGLLTKYLVNTLDGIYVYELISIEKMNIPASAFSVPTDYQLIKMDDFIQLFGEEETIE